MPGVAEQPLDVRRTELGDGVDVELGERTPEVLTLAQDRQPRQTGLEALEAQLLEQPGVVGDAAAPLVVVVVDVQRVVAAPPAPRHAVGRRPQQVDGPGTVTTHSQSLIASTGTS